MAPAPRSGLSFLAACAAAAAVLWGVQAGYGLLITSPGFASASGAVQEFAFTGALSLLLIVVALIGMRIDRIALRSLVGGRPLANLGIGAALGIGGFIAAMLLSKLALALVPGQAGGAGLGALLAGTLLVILQAGAEELYFRGWLQPALQRGWGRWGGLAAAAIAFAGLHMVGGDLSLLSMLNLLLGGLWFGLLAERSGGVLLPALAHIGWNWAEAIGFGLIPNPGIGSFGAIADYDLGGPANWGGTAEGLNASIGMSFALVALLLLALAWRGRSATTAPRG
jgi:hypothetical protein